MSNIPPADFSAMIPGAPAEETNVDNAREPIPNAPLVTQIPASDPAKSLADQIADILGEPPAQRDPDATIVTPAQFPSQQPPAQEPAQEPTPPPATPAPSAPAPSSPPGGEGEGGGDAVSGPSAAPPDSPTDTPSSATLTDAERVSLDALAEQLYGRPPSRDESLAIMQLWEDVARLTPEQKQQVARAMGYIPDDTPAPPTTRPAPAPSTPTAPDPDDDSTDPYLAPHLQPLQHDLIELRSQVQSLVSDRQQTQAQQMEQEVNGALAAFRDQNAHLSPEEHAALQLRIRQNGIVAANYQQTGNIADSVTRALEYEMYRDENMRAKLLQVQQEQEREQVQQQQQRQHKAASLGPGGAQVPRDEPTPPPRVMNRHEARDAMRAELQPLFNQR